MNAILLFFPPLCSISNNERSKISWLRRHDDKNCRHGRHVDCRSCSVDKLFHSFFLCTMNFGLWMTCLFESYWELGILEFWDFLKKNFAGMKRYSSAIKSSKIKPINTSCVFPWYLFGVWLIKKKALSSAITTAFQKRAPEPLKKLVSRIILVGILQTFHFLLLNLS